VVEPGGPCGTFGGGEVGPCGHCGDCMGGGVGTGDCTGDCPGSHGPCCIGDCVVGSGIAPPPRMPIVDMVVPSRPTPSRAGLLSGLRVEQLTRCSSRPIPHDESLTMVLL
jgi:hypothetical protein